MKTDPYADLRPLYDDALNRAIRRTAEGITITWPSEVEAVRARDRGYKMRDADRRASRKLFDPNDPRFGTSIYDKVSAEVDGCKLNLRVVVEQPKPEVTPLPVGSGFGSFEP